MRKPKSQLEDFAENRRLVSVARNSFPNNPATSEGYVVGWSPSLLVLHRMSDRIDLDGYEVLRTADISAVLTDFHQRDFLVSAASIKKLEPRKPRNIDAADLQQLLSSIQANYPLIALERELATPGECDIGRVTLFDRGRFRMRLLSAGAEWVDGDQWYSLDEITRVTFDGEYENTLAMVAGIDLRGYSRTA